MLIHLADEEVLYRIRGNEISYRRGLLFYAFFLLFVGYIR